LDKSLPTTSYTLGKKGGYLFWTALSSLRHYNLGSIISRIDSKPYPFDKPL